jgi:hypothetical protein
VFGCGLKLKRARKFLSHRKFSHAMKRKKKEEKKIYKKLLKLKLPKEKEGKKELL